MFEILRRLKIRLQIRILHSMLHLAYLWLFCYLLISSNYVYWLKNNFNLLKFLLVTCLFFFCFHFFAKRFELFVSWIILLSTTLCLRSVYRINIYDGFNPFKCLAFMIFRHGDLLSLIANAWFWRDSNTATSLFFFSRLFFKPFIIRGNVALGNSI